MTELAIGIIVLMAALIVAARCISFFDKEENT